MATVVNENMKIIELIRLDEGVADILMNTGMHCIGCAMAHGETLGEAASVHGIEPQGLVDSINCYLASKEQ